MPTINENLLPATTGLTLGNSNQQWIAYLSNAFAGTVQSLTANPAQAGLIRLASADTIAWRNNNNSADVTLSKTGAAVTTTPADTLVFSGGGFEGPFISHIASPGGNGELRLANGDQINWRNASASADEGISNATAGGLQLNGANPNIRLGGATASFPMIKRNAANLELRLADDSLGTGLTLSNLTISNNLAVVTSYGSTTLAGNGLAANIVAVDLTAQTAAIGSTNLLTGSGSGPAAGQYRISWNAKVTTVAGTSSTLGPLTIIYTDPDNVGQSITAPATIAAGTIATSSAGNTTSTVLLGVPLLINVRLQTTVAYTFGYASNAASAMNYNLHIVVERL